MHSIDLAGLDFHSAAVIVSLLVAPQALAADSFAQALTGGKPSADIRYRYEAVDQNSTLTNAKASTLRARLGYETGEFKGFGVLLEAESVVSVGSERYNSTVNGRTSHSVVADPIDTEINQAYLSFSGIVATKLKYGRQRLILDNQRFIGNVAWRQNEQTFDAFTVVNDSLPRTKITAGYIYNVNRVFSEKSPAGNFKMSSPVFNVNYKGWSVGELSGYGYLLDFANLPASSTQTYGLRFKGSAAASSALKLNYTAEYASQSDLRDNPRSFRVKYYSLEGGAALSGADFRLGHELLGSDRTTSFQTPLATLHAFNGWADLFLTTPAAGLRDAYAAAGTTAAGIRLEAIYHDFRADKGGARYGKEWDLQAVMPFAARYALGAKYASYRATTFSVDTEKFWIWVEAKF